MTEEDKQGLNFYSKYTRSKDKHSIHSLYTLIDGARSAQKFQIQIATSRVKQQTLPQPKRKTSASPIRKLKAISTFKKKKKVEVESQQQEEQQGEISRKIKQLKKMQDQFHLQLDRRQKQIRKKRESQIKMKQMKQSKQKNLINVIQIKESSPLKEKSSVVKLKKTVSQKEPLAQNQELDFSDYYRDQPEVDINTEYENSPIKGTQLRNTLEMQKLRQKQVQSVDEDGDKPDSIVIQRIDITGRMQNQQSVEHKNIYEIEMSHSRSQNILDQFRSSQEIKQDDKVDPLAQIQNNDDYWQVNINTIPKQVESMENIRSQDIPSSPLPDQTQNQQIIQYSQCQNIDLSPTPDKSLEIQNRDGRITDRSGRQQAPVPITNRTGTDEGQELKEQIADRVEPMASQSQCVPKSIEVQTPIYHSQAHPSSKLHLSREVMSIATDSHEANALDSPIQKVKKSQNKKSSFKKLMAQNRANLVPRMAISTILNEHINEALVDFKQPSPATPDLKQSVFEPKQDSSVNKKKVNFKQKLAQNKRDKSYSRDTKPNFQRDQAKVEKNRRLLVGFFQDN